MTYARVAYTSDAREQGRKAARSNAPRESNPYVLWAYAMRVLWFRGFDEVRR